MYMYMYIHCILLIWVCVEDFPCLLFHVLCMHMYMYMYMYIHVQTIVCVCVCVCVFVCVEGEGDISVGTLASITCLMSCPPSLTIIVPV